MEMDLTGTIYWHQPRYGDAKGSCPHEGKTFKVDRSAPMFVEAEEIPGGRWSEDELG
jgi:hypothetical protein